MAETKKKSGGKKKTVSKISNTEWGLVIGVLLVIDLVQIGLNLTFAVGLVLNRFIDVAIAFAWPTYLKLRGVNLEVKKLGSIALSFFMEQIPGVDSLPFWTADGLFMLFSVKAEELIEKKTGIDAEKAVEAIETESNDAETSQEKSEEEKEKTEDKDEEEEKEQEEETSGQKDGQKEKDEDKVEEKTVKDAEKVAEQTVGLPKERQIKQHRTISKKDSERIGAIRNPNELDLQQNHKNSGKTASEESIPNLDNILDLSLSYGARKKKWEEEQEGRGDEDQPRRAA